MRSLMQHQTKLYLVNTTKLRYAFPYAAPDQTVPGYPLPNWGMRSLMQHQTKLYLVNTTKLRYAFSNAAPDQTVPG